MMLSVYLIPCTRYAYRETSRPNIKGRVGDLQPIIPFFRQETGCGLMNQF